MRYTHAHNNIHIKEFLNHFCFFKVCSYFVCVCVCGKKKSIAYGSKFWDTLIASFKNWERELFFVLLFHKDFSELMTCAQVQLSKKCAYLVLAFIWAK